MKNLFTKQRLSLFFKGMAMGAADVIPGVSGGTVALITGIYGHLVGAITDFNFHKVRALLWLVRSGHLREQGKAELMKINWAFLIPLGMGIVFSILVLSRGMVAVMETYPAPTYAFFFGLILVSIKYPYQEMSKNVVNHIVLAVFAVLAFAFFSLPTNMSLDVSNPANVFFGGAVAVCALILPGISGSTFLVILGLYKPILEALHARELGTIVVFVSGMAVGLLTFIRVLNWCLAKHKHTTMAALAGLMLGSLKKVWPYEAVAEVSESQWVLLAFCAVGVALIYCLDKFAGSLQNPAKLTGRSH
jgi:putative membrane protein